MQLSASLQPSLPLVLPVSACSPSRIPEPWSKPISSLPGIVTTSRPCSLPLETRQIPGSSPPRSLKTLRQGSEAQINCPHSPPPNPLPSSLRWGYPNPPSYWSGTPLPPSPCWDSPIPSLPIRDSSATACGWETWLLPPIRVLTAA